MIGNTKTDVYRYVQAFDQYLLSEVTNIYPEVFDNGSCYDKIEITSYTEYTNNCSSDNIDSRPMENHTLRSDFGKLLISPNPASDKIVINVPQYKGKSKVTLYSVSGQPVVFRSLKHNSKSYELDVNNLPVGVYTLRLVQGNSVYSNKFVKQ